MNSSIEVLFLGLWKGRDVSGLGWDQLGWNLGWALGLFHLSHSLWTSVFFSRQMADRQEDERKHIMFLNASAGNWHFDSSISQGKSPGLPTSMGRGRSLCPKRDALQRPMAKGTDIQFLIQGEGRGVGTVTQLVTAS